MQIQFGKTTIDTHYINPFLHSVFGEYIGTLIYDGTYVGIDSPIENIDGLRKATVDGLKEAGVAAIRWPGGCTADHYRWKDGIGKNRKSRMPFSVSQQGEFRHDYGTDEFIKLCRLVGAEPIIVANVATGTPEEFLNWFEYCNGDIHTKYGALRAENGNPEPYNVKYWGLGNTDENVWHIAYNDPVEYARDFRKYRTVIMGSLGDIKLIGLGLSERHETYGWVESCLDYITGGQKQKGPDSLSVHHYIGGMKARYYECEESVCYSDEAYTFTIDALKAYQTDIDLHRKYIAEHCSPKFKTTICFDEWGLWHPEATEENGLNQAQTMRDAIFAACSFHLFYKNSDIVEYAMETQYANVLQSLFETNGELFVNTPTFYVFKLFKEHLGKYMLPVSMPENDDIDCFASADSSLDHITVSAVNKHLCRSYELDFSALSDRYDIVKADILTSQSVRDRNTFETPDAIRDKPIRRTHSICLPAHSIVRLCFYRKIEPFPKKWTQKSIICE